MPSVMIASVLIGWLIQQPAVPAPAVSAIASAQPHAEFAGSWKYNPDDSVNAQTGRPETARALAQRRGVSRGNADLDPAAAPTGLPGEPPRRGSEGTGPGGVIPTGSVGPQDVLYNLYVEQRDTQRDLMEIAPRLDIAVTPAAVTITDDLNRSLTFAIGAKKQRYQLGAALFEARAAWDGGQLKIDVDGPDGLKITETWFLNDDGSRLYQIIRVGDPTDKDTKPTGVNRVYDRVNPL